MKKIKAIKFVLIGILFLVVQLSYAQTSKQDSLKEVSVIGIFDGKKTIVGNFDIEEVYKIKEFCISLSDISDRRADSLKGKRILVTGKLKIVEGRTHPAKTSTDGKIYEPYIEPDKKFIIEPKFTIVYDAREPANK